MSLVEQCIRFVDPTEHTRVWEHDGTASSVAVVDSFVPLPIPKALDADGTRLVGRSYDGQAAACSVGGGNPPNIELPPIPGTSPLSSIASDVSASGQVIVGRATLPEGDVAVWWVEDVGAGRLRERLGPPAGWMLTEAVAISRDGRVVAGNGIDSDGRPEAWIAFLPARVPTLHAPLAVLGGALVATASALFATRRLRLRRVDQLLDGVRARM